MTAHVPTLALSFLLISLTLAAVLLFAAHHQAAGIRLWAVALAAYALSLIIGGIGGPESLAVRIYAANMLLSGSYALLGQGLMQFHANPARRWLVWLPVALAGVVFALTADNFALRVVLGSLLLIGQILLALHLLNAKQTGDVGRGRPLIATGLLALVAIILWRMWEVANQAGHPELSGPAALTEAIHLGGAMVTVILITVGLLIMNNERARSTLRHLALHDALTDLPNRSVFDSHLAAELATAKRNKEGFGLLFLDLDGFKEVNDRYGHGFGDAVLKQVAGRLRTALRQSDLIARIGGDEFVVLRRRVSLRDDAERVAGKIHAALETPFELDTHRIACGASIGIALYPQHGEDAVALVAHADQAMYRAKSRGLGRTEVFHAPRAEQAAGNGL
ncbi:hypothetical protein GCM10010960_13940 [Arenimonas maotaiensis]|uniref:GGDEF domain-containing protein n=1 Tax=Arenimonas maotaiensis TaxID=1446479 RepID=A0A917CQQ3_9GAMM|nr:GGDEF domain-containing protein [Arenimonas maotaiensis]GGF93276.1 hypothetical protein GCM10010960_13940 [Arenimonas maotaiensis]